MDQIFRKRKHQRRIRQLLRAELCYGEESLEPQIGELWDQCLADKSCGRLDGSRVRNPTRTKPPSAWTVEVPALPAAPGFFVLFDEKQDGLLYVLGQSVPRPDYGR